jgi:hypothetical protein
MHPTIFLTPDLVLKKTLRHFFRDAVFFFYGEKIRPKHRQPLYFSIPKEFARSCFSNFWLPLFKTKEAMKAIEINTKTDKYGYLKFNYPLEKKESKVRVILLVDEKSDEVDEEQLWMRAISSNPAFSFLNDAEENIYTLADGEPFND